MASQDHHYSSDFKARVALEAIGQKKLNLDRLSEKYDVPVSFILTWTLQLERNADNIFATTTEPTDVSADTSKKSYVDIDVADEEISDSIHVGVMSDDLNIKKLTFWCVLGIVFLVIFVQGVKEMYDVTQQVDQDQISAQSTFHEVSAEKEQSRKDLSSFGVVDIEKGVYRIPIDSAIKNMVVDSK